MNKKWIVLGLALAVFVAGLGVGLFSALSEPVTAYDEQSLNEYLEENVAWKNEGGVIVQAFHLYGSGENELYLWYLFEERSSQDRYEVTHAGASLPIVVYIDEDGKPVIHKEPMDGDYYAESIKDMFPASIARKILNGAPSSLFDSLESQVERLQETGQ